MFRYGPLVRLNAPNLANVKPTGQAGPDPGRGTVVSHSGWNLDVVL
jgi:hypothetical protein